MKLSGTIQNVTQTTLGSQLAADVLIGDSTVTVVDGSDFNEDDGTGSGGGTLLIGGSQVDYTTIDNTTNVITLATTLAVNASEGDRVDVVDPSTAVASVDVVAFVALPGGNGNDDFVQASVAHALALTLDPGIRDPGMGEAATIEEIHPGDGEWVVVDVRGKRSTVRNSTARLGVKVNIPAASLTGGAIGISAWDSVIEQAGTALQLATPDDGTIYSLTPGTYCVNAFLAANGINTAPANCVISLFQLWTGSLPPVAATVHGGDDPIAGPPSWGASCSATYFQAGDPGFVDNFAFELRYANLDPAVTSVDVQVFATLITAS